MAALRHNVTNLARSFERGFQTLNRIEISQQAITNNFDLFQRLNPAASIIPVLKSNAYGHGLADVTEILKAREFPYIAVDGYYEALRAQAVSRQPVLVMGSIDPANFTHLKYHNLTFVVQDEATIRAIGQTGRRVKVHLEINTGMNRMGVEPDRLDGYLDLIKSFPGLQLEGVMSHLADADDLNSDFTNRQTEQFDACVKRLFERGFKPKFIHLAQTAGSIKAKSKYANAMRLGLGLYGINPLDPADPAYHQLDELKPALQLRSTIAKVVDVKPGDKVSYNGIFTATRATRIGVLPLGYYEGVRRNLSQGGVVKWSDQYLHIAGKVCMNHTMVDLGDSGAKVGDKVTLISDNPEDQTSVLSICRQFNLLSYELLTSINQNVRRVVV